MTPVSAGTSCSTVLPSVPSGYSAALRAAKSPPLSKAMSAQVRANFWNCSFLATKSVSQLTSTSTPLASSALTTTRPSDALRPARLAAAASPFFLRMSRAASMSPSVSVSAFLQSIMPAPVFSRSSLTNVADTAAICRDVAADLGARLSCLSCCRGPACVVSGWVEGERGSGRSWKHWEGVKASRIVGSKKRRFINDAAGKR
mmetsp:Transcript_18954/g.45692  ORF Transcript_18954/g.45692 Transcript_18954/m.45692 type:complete len:202 (+) Transcript_18954:760-1365(+)